MSSTVYNNVKSLLRETRLEFSKFLRIQHREMDLSENLEDIMNLCGLTTIGAGYADFLIDNDIIIFPMFDSSLSSAVLAAAAPCLISTNYRPYGGVLLINPGLNFNKENTNLYMKNLLLHEITHILAFHPYYFNALKMNKTMNSKPYITSSRVLTQARKHFNCNSITGVQLENQGGDGSAGSHWESRYMLGDFMISTDYPDSTISDITLALFEDTGFYKVNYYSGGLFKFGKNKGCNFLSDKCIQNEEAAFDEFCDEAGEAKCSSSRSLKSSCYLITYSYNLDQNYQYFSNPRKGGYSPADYCPVPFERHSSDSYFQKHCRIKKANLTDYGETMGDNSLCFMSTLTPDSVEELTTQVPICYEFECDTSNSQINIKVGSSTITCPTDGSAPTIPSGFKGTIECPKYDEICSSNDGLICNDMFSCFTQLAEKDGYNYQTTYSDYSGAAAVIDEEEDYEDYYIVRRSSSYNITFNFALLLILFIIIL